MPRSVAELRHWLVREMRGVELLQTVYLGRVKHGVWSPTQWEL